jgi:hypothetical protein
MLITRSKTKNIQVELISLILDYGVSKLQIYQTRFLCTVWVIYKATRGILLRFYLDWKIDISRFSSIYG